MFVFKTNMVAYFKISVMQPIRNQRKPIMQNYLDENVVQKEKCTKYDLRHFSNMHQ